MQNFTCNNCGSTNPNGTKFCRQCGAPVAEFTLNEPSITEATTRRFDYQQSEQATSAFAPTALTAPAYLAPNAEQQPSPAPTTGKLVAPHKAGGSSRSNLFFVLVVPLMLFLIIGAVGITWWVARSPQSATTPAPPAVPAIPSAPPAPVGAVNPNIDQDLLYPGTRTMLNAIRDQSGSQLVQMRSTDDFEKIVEWYVAKLKPTRNTRSGDSSVILQSEATNVVITKSGNATNIIIKRRAAQKS